MFNALIAGVLSRRSATILIAVLVFAFGIYATTQLQEELLPNFNFPYLVITTADPGASSQVVADQVSQPIEAAITQLAGVQQVNSTSLQGFSVILAQFNFGINTDTAQQQLTTKLRTVALPTTVNGTVVQPSVTTLNLNSRPILYMTVEGQQGQTSAQVAQWADQVATPALSKLSDVGNVQVVGDTGQQVFIALNASALLAHGLSVNDVSTALAGLGISFPAGTADVGGQLVPVRVAASVQNAAALNMLIITSTKSGKTAHLQDVAHITAAQIYPNGTSRVNSTPGVVLNIYKSQTGNTVRASDGVLATMATLNRDHPEYHLTAIYDQAQQIRNSITGVVREGILGAIFAILVIFLFLRNVRSTLVTAISIPTSIIVALLLIWTQGISLNTLTLGGLAIAVGRVVDDAIVVLENITRHVQQGEPVRDAVVRGTREVAGAITTSTITTIAVFLPLGFVGGVIGQIFLPFALTVSFALAASLVVALTLVPIFASLFIKPYQLSVRQSVRLTRQNTTWLQDIYTPVLRWALKHRWGTLGIAVALLVLSLGSTAIFGLQAGFLPNSNATLIQASLVAPRGSDPSVTTQSIQQIEAVLARYRSNGRIALYEVTTTGSSSLDLITNALQGSNATANVLITVPANTNANALASDLQRDLKPAAPTGGNITVAASGSFAGSSGGLSYTVQGPDSASVKAGSDAVLRALQGLPHIANLKSDVSALTPQIVITPDPTKSALANSALIGSELSALLQGQGAGTITFADGSQAQILVAVPGLGGADLASYIANIQALPLAPGVKVGDVATVQEQDGVTQVTRINGSLAATISADITSDTTGPVTTQAAKDLQGIVLPAGVTVTQAGVGQQQSQAFSGLGLALLAAIALVYLVMVLAFGSLREPFAILLSLPLAAIGGVGALVVTHHELDLSSLIGFLMLIGIVVTNAVVLLDLFKQLQAQGLGTEEALMQAGRTRVRPILMTALATILALVPLALGIGGNEGSIIASDLGVVVIGGLLTSTLLTLVVVPVAASLLNGKRDQGTATPPTPEEVPMAPTPALSGS